MVTKHLTKAKFGMEVFKFCLCLSIPGVAVLVFRVRLACWPRHARKPQKRGQANAPGARMFSAGTRMLSASGASPCSLVRAGAAHVLSCP
jgi:hypothetical protein